MDELWTMHLACMFKVHEGREVLERSLGQEKTHYVCRLAVWVCVGTVSIAVKHYTSKSVADI